jgi:hypothetical protein
VAAMLGIIGFERTGYVRESVPVLLLALLISRPCCSA